MQLLLSSDDQNVRKLTNVDRRNKKRFWLGFLGFVQNAPPLLSKLAQIKRTM